MLNINPDNLNDPQEFEKISKEAQECDHFNYIGEYGVKSYQIMLAIDDALEKHPQFKTENSELYKKYRDLSLYLKFHNLERLPEDNDVLNLLENHFGDALQKNLDLENWLRAKVMMKGLIFRNDFISKALVSIKKNQQTIGEKNITISNKEVLPTIQNWIKDYEYTAEPGIHSLVERNGYFIHSKNVRELKEEERKQVKLLLQLYDKLHLKVNDIGGLGSYPPSVYGIDLKKPVAVEDFTTKEQEKIDKSVLEPAGTVRPIPFPTKKTEQREKILAENKKEAEKAMQGAIDIKKMEEAEPANKFIKSVKNIGKPQKKSAPKTSFKLVKPQPKIIQAVPKKEVFKTAPKPKTKPVLAEEYLKKQAKPEQPEIKSKPIEPKIPLKTFHKEKKQVTMPSKPVSEGINKIQNISLADFKNLGQNAKQCAQALLTKIREVAKTHEERAAARANFTKSPLYKLYQAMENQSATEKKSISQLAEDRKKTGTEFLTEDEYIAVKSVSKLI